MAQNGRRKPPRPRIEVVGATASPEEAAAISGALEQFLAETSSAPGQAQQQGGWQRAALRDAVEARSLAGEVWGNAPR